MQDNDRLDLQLFARRGGRNYMMRSEKRPGYNRPAQKPRPRRRRRNVGYIVLTLIVAILLWPVGLFLISVSYTHLDVYKRQVRVAQGLNGCCMP